MGRRARWGRPGAAEGHAARGDVLLKDAVDEALVHVQHHLGKAAANDPSGRPDSPKEARSKQKEPGKMSSGVGAWRKTRQVARVGRRPVGRKAGVARGNGSFEFPGCSPEARLPEGEAGPRARRRRTFKRGTDGVVRLAGLLPPTAPATLLRSAAGLPGRAAAALPPRRGPPAASTSSTESGVTGVVRPAPAPVVRGGGVSSRPAAAASSAPALAAADPRADGSEVAVCPTLPVADFPKSFGQSGFWLRSVNRFGAGRRTGDSAGLPALAAPAFTLGKRATRVRLEAIIKCYLSEALQQSLDKNYHLLVVEKG